MQTKMRQEIDADLNEDKGRATRLRTEQNQHEIPCSICSQNFFVDNVTYENVARGIELGRDNPFVCPDCQIAYDEAADENR
jgi:hypothetical protein